MEIGALGWLWRGLTGHSVTFATLFASLVLGVSISGGVNRLLAALGVHWLYVMLLPILGFAWMDRREPRWIPDPARRRRLARAILLGSALLAIGINQVRH